MPLNSLFRNLNLRSNIKWLGIYLVLTAVLFNRFSCSQVTIGEFGSERAWIKPIMSSSTIKASNGIFQLLSKDISYLFHVHTPSGELIHDHFGASSTETTTYPPILDGGWGQGHDGFALSREKRELPDVGRGDYRLPGIVIRKKGGNTLIHLKYKDHKIVEGKPNLPGLPSTFGSPSDVSTLLITLHDPTAHIQVVLSYSIFGAHNAIARSMQITNHGKEEIVVEQAASMSLDLGTGEWEMGQLSGDWAREAQIVRRPVVIGTQGFGSLTGYSSHLHNPFLTLFHPSTTETHGEAYGFSLIYTGSFSAQVEKNSVGLSRVVLGLHPQHLSWPLAPGESFTTPEAVAVYSQEGLGGMSRSFHGLFRKHLSRSKWTFKERPALNNNWEATYFDLSEDNLSVIAKKASELGVKLFVMDDGWFGNGKNARTSDHSGLGDWVVNKQRFPNGLDKFVGKITEMKVAGKGEEKMKFGIWVEPEMINKKSDLFEAHPEWVLHAEGYEITEVRNQMVLNLAIKDVQDYIIDRISEILSSANISYVKWDNNRGMHELPSPSTPHAYILGLYRVIDTLTTRFPDVLWEGCASGGGRFDPGLYHYWAQSWTSDNTDAADRLYIQFGTSLVYPPSSFGAHVSAVPNHQTDRVTSLEFRAHVAMMGGSFGFELDLNKLPKEEQEQIPKLIELSEKVNPFVINGDLYRLARPDESNFPAALFVLPDKSAAALLAYRMLGTINWHAPALRLQGLDPEATYVLEEVGEKNVEYQGKTLMGVGLKLAMRGDYKSRVILLKRK